MLENTKLYQELQNRNSKYIVQIDETYKYASEVLPKINRVFANYTGHGIEHSVNVMKFMRRCFMMLEWWLVKKKLKR